MSGTHKGIFLAVAWAHWALPFLIFFPAKRGKPVETDRRANWGLLLEAVAFFLVYAHGASVWAEPATAWRILAASCCALPGIVFSWTSVRQLGPQWRVQAGLNADHRLVRTGAYRVVRHPVYASMLWMLLAGIAVAGTLPSWPVALALFILGTEIRVRVEDRLLASRFGAEFQAWRRTTPAYLPLIR